ncbi:MAG: hypothetical protein LBH69_02890 [Methanomassiliicoccaceae archaeon]|jgi:alpha-tubulin suppressor-like RCC1 family protein|nr:hypothetical protein [Methanomassiliicoccaceae archaeon]
MKATNKCISVIIAALFISMAAMAAVPGPEGDGVDRNVRTLGSDPFVPVTNISDVPNLAYPGTPLALTGTVSPDNATYQQITWSVLNANATGATISGSTFNATAPGSMTVLATIENGRSLGGWATVSAGNAHTMAIKYDGTLWGWGEGTYGQLGLGMSFMYLSYPFQVGTASDWMTVAAGDGHTVAIKTDGTLWAWGHNLYGQIGDGTTRSDRYTPVKIGTDTDWAMVSAGYGHTVAIKTDGTLWSWGFNQDGQLGNGTLSTDETIVPTKVGTDDDWVMVTAGRDHTLAIKEDGTLWAWGCNSSGELGDNDTREVRTPKKIGTDEWKDVSGGFMHSLGIKADGSLWAWGWNSSGQLGSDVFMMSKVPVRIGDANDWSSVSAGMMSSAAIKNDGSLWTWGENRNGQLGDGTDTNRIAPVRVGSGETWNAVSIGTDFTAAINDNGIDNDNMWTWGKNNGRLGDGMAADRRLPANIDNYMRPFQINVASPNPPTFTNNPAYNIPASTVGIAIQNINLYVAVSGGTPSYSFSATGLPAGLEIDTVGVISGTPTAAGPGGTATITVTDRASKTASITISYGAISAASVPEPPAITTASLQNGTVGAAYSETLTAAGDPAIAWSIIGSLPGGLTIAGDTISGTPTASGTFSFTVKAENDAGADTKALSVTIAPAPVPPIDVAAAGEWKKGAGTGYTITVSADISKFTGVKMNGITVDPSNYSAVSGSTVITFKEAYMSALSAGDHTIDILFTDATASTTLKITADNDGEIGGNGNGNGGGGGSGGNGGKDGGKDGNGDDNGSLMIYAAIAAVIIVIAAAAFYLVMIRKP